MITFSAIDYYYGITSSSEVNIFGGKYIDCSICNAFISNSRLQNCDLENDFVQKTIVIDTKFTESVIQDSDIESSNSIIVQTVDIWTFLPSATSSNLDNATGVLKIYINDFDIEKFNIFDSIYTTKLNKKNLVQNLNIDQIIELPYETRWVFNNFLNDDISDDVISVTFKKSDENKYKTIAINELDIYSSFTYLNDILDENNKPWGSIDIEIGNYLANSYFGLRHYIDFYIDVYSRPILISATVSFLPLLDVDTVVDVNLLVRNTSFIDVLLPSDYLIPKKNNSTFKTTNTLRNFVLDTSTYSVNYSISSDNRISWTPRFYVRLLTGDLECECCTTTTTIPVCPTDLFTYSYVLSPSSNAFTFVVDTTITGTTSSNNQFVLQMLGGGYNANINWGDGSNQNILGSPGNITHTYPSPGTYTIQITGTFPRIYNYTGVVQGTNEQLKIINVTQWGNIVWNTFELAFWGCQNLNVTATDTPILTNVQSLSGMFRDCVNLTGNTYFNDWNVSGVLDMNGMFVDCTNFNQPLSGWNVSNVTNMGAMFLRCTNFNQPLNNWDVSNVTSMSIMFSFCTNFNQPLNGWNVSNVTQMNGMFEGSTNFNQPLNNWIVSGVTDMERMFTTCSNFNQPLNNWNVCNVSNMDSMFNNCTSYDQDISTWKVPLIPVKPTGFDTSTPGSWLTAEKPQWGVSCP